MSDNSHANPVTQLLTLGEPKATRELAWSDYRELGIGPAHVPALIEIATDQDLLCLPDERDPHGWAPVHAWRALGQLGAREAIEPLMGLFNQVRDNDWIIEEMPDVFALIGPEAFPALSAYLRDAVYPVYARLVAANSLTQIALAHPETRLQCVEELAAQLEGFVDNTAGMNGALIANLVELSAFEKTDLIHRVFSDGHVDRFIAGDWRDVKNRLRRASGARPTQPAKPASGVMPDPGPRSQT